MLFDARFAVLFFFSERLMQQRQQVAAAGKPFSLSPPDSPIFPSKEDERYSSKFMHASAAAAAAVEEKKKTKREWMPDRKDVTTRDSRTRDHGCCVEKA